MKIDCTYKMFWASVGITTVLCSICSAQNKAAKDAVHQARGDGGMVVSASRAASEIGRDVLADGGNAVDAAVATAFALAVTWPEAGNIGGGGFMMVNPGDASQPPVCIDYREKAPLAATPTMFNRNDGRHRHKIVGVPGTVRGLALAHEKYGKLSWRRLVEPAAKLAQNGFLVDHHLADSTNRILSYKSVRTDPRYAELLRVYGHPDKRPWRDGDQMKLPDLAKTLMLIATDGSDAFYKGKIADLLVAEMGRGDGIITKKDLNQYNAKTRKPIRGTFRGYEVLGPPPPSSGGTVLVQMLNILETFDLRKHDRFSARNLHVTAEAMRRAYRDRALYLGDADFVKIPAHLTTKKYARKLAKEIDTTKATPSEELGEGFNLVDEAPSTTHFSVVDANGMAVSNTYTLEGVWGSRIVVRGAGFVLNNEMGDFNWFPGRTDRRGYIGTPPNRIAPGKRMLSSQTPTIVTRDGKVVLVAGSPGGRTIINTVLTILLNVLEFEMDLATAVDSPRVHHQWFPDQFSLEADDNRYGDVAKHLQKLGHKVVSRSSQGSAHCIAIDQKTGKRHGVADRRRGGWAASTSK